MDELVKKMWYTHTRTHICNGILYSHKKHEISPVATAWMGFEGIVMNGIDQEEKDK